MAIVKEPAYEEFEVELEEDVVSVREVLTRNRWKVPVAPRLDIPTRLKDKPHVVAEIKRLAAQSMHGELFGHVVSIGPVGNHSNKRGVSMLLQGKDMPLFEFAQRNGFRLKITFEGVH